MKWLVFCSSLLALWGGVYADDKRPNVIIVFPDDMGWGEIAATGNTEIKTPNLDAFYKGATRLTNFNVAPTCAPSRAQLMSGRHEFFAGVTHTTVGRNKMRDDIKILPQYMKQAGYQTGMFGKWHLGDGKGVFGKELSPDKRGFDTALYTSNQLMPRFNPKLIRNGKKVVEKGYCVDVVFREAITWMDACDKEKPFFTYIATSAPHEPLAAPKEQLALYAESGLPKYVQTYYAMISSIDENFGKLIEWNQGRGSSRETLILFMTDNGHAISGAFGLGHDRYTGVLAENGQYNMGMRGGKVNLGRAEPACPF